MALDNKYRVHEVAKDFGVSTREITEILTKYRTEPKNHMQVLDDADLSVIFEYMTSAHSSPSARSSLPRSRRRSRPRRRRSRLRLPPRSSRYTASIRAAPAT